MKKSQNSLLHILSDFANNYQKHLSFEYKYNKWRTYLTEIVYYKHSVQLTFEWQYEKLAVYHICTARDELEATKETFLLGVNPTFISLKKSTPARAYSQKRDTFPPSR